MKPFALSLMLAASALLVGCGGGVAESLGFGRNPPDAFAVVDRAPLSVPPEFSLRPPVPGAPRPQEATTTQQAEEIVSGGVKAIAASEESNAEKALLARADADKADPYIRDLVDWEASQKTEKKTYLIGRLLGMSDTQDASQTIDAQEEARRLHEEKQNTTSSPEAPVQSGS